MGRLPYSEGAVGRTSGRGQECAGDRGQENGGAGGESRPITLAERLEEWRHDPDMCLVYAAFCTNSALTLSDGLRLAKTRRKPSAVLQLLTGGDSGSEGTPPGSPHRADGAAAAAAKAAPFQLAGAKPVSGGGGLGGLFDDDAVSEGPCTALPSPALGASASPMLVPRALRAPGAAAAGTMQQRLELGLAGTCAHHPKPAQPKLPPPCSPASQRHPFSDVRRRLDSGCGAVVSQGYAAPEAFEDSIRHDAFAAGFFGRVAEVPFKPWTASEFAAIGLGHRLAKSIHGEVRLLGHVASSSSSSSCSRGFDVAVAKVIPNEAMERGRRARETDERRAWLSSSDVPPMEDMTNEIAVLAYLQCSQERSPHVVRLLGAFQDAASSYLVTEYCEGGELFERAAYGEPLSEAEKMRYVAQLLLAVQHLHTRNVGHRDISLENVLLKNGDCVLADFGQAVPLRSLDGKPLRYFVEAGKRMYRSPEMYVPRQSVVQVVCPGDAKPGTVAQVSYDKCRCEVLLPLDATPGLPCAAEPCGYEAAPADIFAVGVCAFVLTVGKPPWNVARDADPTFSFVRRHGVPMLLKQWRGGGAQPSSAGEESFLAQLLRTEPSRRPGAVPPHSVALLRAAGPHELTPRRANSASRK
mmetsp:Transcript_112169/g.324042  ORF Transcript_112169/g.324042 Transcript_112169/m.324042 type:complete len:638 (-) Transcript_112169:48-1961(-)